MHRRPAGSEAELSSWGGLETQWTCSLSCCPGCSCWQALDMAHLCVVMDQGSTGHGPPVIAGCHNQCHVSPCLCHADRQLDGGLSGWGGGRGVGGAPGGTHARCTAPHTAHTGTHIHSPSQPAARGPWAEPGARSSPPPPSRGVPGMDTPHWSPAPPALEHKYGEGRAQAQEKGVRNVRYPHYSHSLLCCRHPGRALQPTVCPLLPKSLQPWPPGQKRGDSEEHCCEAAAPLLSSLHPWQSTDTYPTNV